MTAAAFRHAPSIKDKKDLERVTTARAREFIQQEVASHQVVIWSKSYCPHCHASKELFRSLDGVHDVVIHELDLGTDSPQTQNELRKMTGQSTVPNIFVNGRHLGGNSDVQEAYRSGELQTLLEQTRA